MPLAEYLASEQAREDVRVAVNAMATSKTSTFCGGLEDHWIESTHLEAWLRVAYFRFGGKAFLVSAYYRPDGDRYVVTDLGEGVRALRLKGAALREIKPRVDAVMTAMWQEQTEFVAHFPAALIEGEIGTVNHPKAESLPDAICRVLLASLRVAQS